MSNDDDAFSGEPSNGDGMTSFPNMGGVEVKSWHAEPGWYEDAECIKAEDTLSLPPNRKPMFVFTFRIKANRETLELPQRIMKTQSSLPFLLKTVTALGYPPGDDGNLKIKMENFVGRRCAVQLKDKTYNEKLSSEICGIRKHKDGPASGAPPDDDIPF